MISQLILDQGQYDEMLQHVTADVPLEACGLLAGSNGRVGKVILVRNQAQSPVRFVMDPYEQLQALEWIDAQGLNLIGIFHSHPAGPETVSPTDIKEAAYEVVHLVWSCLKGRWTLRGFWIQDGQAQEVTVSVI
jgi:proteasome lid subunit RPN8/RPN11